MSYANLIMLGATLPSYDPPKKGSEGQDVIDASDQRNRQRVKDFFDNID